MKRLKTFEEHNNDIKVILDQLLNKRVKFLHIFSDKEKSDGYAGMDNIRIENNTILFDSRFDKNIEDCKYDDKFFYVVGNEGEEKVLLSGDFLINIKKSAKEVNSGGLK
jgi:hypothetical protein